MESKWWTLSASVLVCWALAAGCSGDKSQPAGDNNKSDAGTSCNAGTTECDGAVLRECAADGSHWIEQICASGSCSNGQCEASSSCTPNTHECLGNGFERLCPPDGSGWVALQCQSGSSCAGGSCSGNGDAGNIDAGTCAQGDATCATSKIAQVCGQGGVWLAQACNQGEICKQGACVTDSTALCSPGDRRCLDTTTSLVCTDDGQGYRSDTCPSGASCVAGWCMGAVCAVGKGQCLASSYPNPSTGYEICEDGTQFVRHDCAVGESCVVGADGSPRCDKAECQQGQSVCGDPHDASVDPTTHVSECRNVNGAWKWVLVECGPAETCGQVANQAQCSRTCQPGTMRCSPDRLGTQACQSDGTWGATTACSGLTDPLLECATRKDGSAVCADPLCVAAGWGTSPMTVGSCSGDQILTCDDSGKLASTAADCPSGTACHSSSQIVDGRKVGSCIPGACTSMCLTDGSGYTKCDNGQSVTVTCPSGQKCLTASYGNLGCGVDCIPGQRQCTASGQIQQCNAQGKWGTPQTCSQGTCKSFYSSGGPSVGCLLDCVPGAPSCIGNTRTAADGKHTGTDTVGYCTAKGTLPTSGTACAADETCRTLTTGESLGCVQCKGVAVADANDPYGPASVDTRCAAGDGGRYTQSCDSNNKWGALGSTTCVDCASAAQQLSSCTKQTTCMCQSCESQVIACSGNAACSAIIQCQRQTHCTWPFGCQSMCFPDGSGGPGFLLANNLMNCSLPCNYSCP